MTVYITKDFDGKGMSIKIHATDVSQNAQNYISNALLITSSYVIGIIL